MVRAALSSLTLRGRAFVAAGLTAVGCAILLGQPALIRVGVLVLVLPLVATVVVAAHRHRLRVTRAVSPRLVRAGETARVELTVTGERRRGDGVLLAEETLPYLLGSRPRFVLRDLEPGWQRSFSYPVRSDLRGRHPVGPLTVRVSDPFGMVERRHTTEGTADLLVTPRILPLPAVPLAGGWQGAGEHRAQSFATGSAEDVSVREYRRGDDLRRVHWRSSARMGELMVRREEQPWEAHAVVLLDDRATTHRGRGAASSFESAVIAAASVAVHLDQHGYAVRLATTAGIVAAGTEEILRHLALAATTERSGLDLGWSGDQARGGIVVGILGALHPADTVACRKIRHDAAAALAIVLDVDQWSATRTSQGPAHAASPLVAVGWRAAGIGPRDQLEAVWRDLGRAPDRIGAGR